MSWESWQEALELERESPEAAQRSWFGRHPLVTVAAIPAISLAPLLLSVALRA